MRQGAKGPQAKQKARINAYNDLANQSEREKLGRAQIIIPNGHALGGKVIESDGLKKAMGDKLLDRRTLASRCPPAASSA